MSMYRCDECGCKRYTDEDGYNETEGLIWCDLCKDMLDEAISSKDKLMKDIFVFMGMKKMGEM